MPTAAPSSSWTTCERQLHVIAHSMPRGYPNSSEHLAFLEAIQTLAQPYGLHMDTGDGSAAGLASMGVMLGLLVHRKSGASAR